MSDEPEVVLDTEVIPEDVADEDRMVLALREQQIVQQGALLPSAAEFHASWALAEKIASTSFVPASYRNKPDEVMAAILFGREINLGPMMSLRDVYMIEGRPVLASHRQLALLRKGIIVIESESTAERAFIRAKRKDTGEEMDVEWTIEDARKINNGKLVNKDNWKNYPADMLWARCVGRLTRRLGPDLLGGLPPYVAEELADLDDWGVEYNATGEPTFRRIEQPKWNGPKNWNEIRDRLVGHLGEHETPFWVKQALFAAYSMESARELDAESRQEAGERMAAVIFDLDEIGPAGHFPPLTRPVIRDVFARHFDGTALVGPPWRLSDDEAVLPTYDEVTHDAGAEPPATADAPAAEPEAKAAETTQTGFFEPVVEEDIPFGE